MMVFKLHKPNKVHSNGEGYITRSGHTMFIQDIVTELNRSKQLEAENKNLNKIKSNWGSLKDLLYLTIDNYGDDEDIDTSVAEQILDEMNKLHEALK